MAGCGQPEAHRGTSVTLGNVNCRVMRTSFLPLRRTAVPHGWEIAHPCAAAHSCMRGTSSGEASPETSTIASAGTLARSAAVWMASGVGASYRQ